MTFSTDYKWTHDYFTKNFSPTSLGQVANKE